MSLARQTVLRRIAALALLVAAAALGWLLLGEPGKPGTVDERGAQVSDVTIESEAVGREQTVRVVVPPGAPAANRPAVIFLHGRGGDETSSATDAFYRALAELEGEAPVVAFPNGGDSSYWHDRADGEWGRYVTEEVVDVLAEQFAVNPERIAVGGISMGGFGAYDAARLHPGRFCAAGGHSPALWVEAGESAEGAFDDAEDFARHDVVAAARTDPRAFAQQAIWLDIGTEDPFVPGADAFLDALEAGGVEFTTKRWPGGHDSDYWDRHWDEYLRFYAHALADC